MDKELIPNDVFRCMERFHRKLRDKLAKQKVKYHYCQRIEQTPEQPPHIHLLFRTSLDNDTFDAMCHECWQEIVGSCNSQVYCKPVRNDKNSAKYIADHWLERKKGRWQRTIPWLPGSEWKGKKLFSYSNGFLSKPMKELWEDVKRDWFPDGKIDWEMIPDWEPPITGDELLIIYREHHDEPCQTDALLEHLDRSDNDKPLTSKRIVINHEDDSQVEAFLQSFDAITGLNQRKFARLLLSQCKIEKPIYWASERVVWQGIPAIIVGKTPLTDTYTINLGLREPSQLELLPKRIKDRIYSPSGMPMHKRVEVDCSEISKPILEKVCRVG